MAVVPFTIILITYGSSTRLPFNIPGSLGALLIGGVLALLQRLVIPESERPAPAAAHDSVALNLPWALPGLLFEGTRVGDVV